MPSWALSIPAKSSATPDSGRPKQRMCTWCVSRAARSPTAGRTLSWNIVCISRGTPGRKKQRAFPTATSKPGAVPSGLGSTVAP